MGPSSNPRMQILDMIAEGKLTAEEGVRLLEALGEGQQPEPTYKAAPAAGIFSGGMVVIRVTKRSTGEVTVNLRVPVSLISTARKLGAKISSDMEDVDLNAVLADLLAGGPGESFRIESEDEIIEILVE